jgi:hypothetical protein
VSTALGASETKSTYVPLEKVLFTGIAPDCNEAFGCCPFKGVNVDPSVSSLLSKGIVLFFNN